MRKTFTQLMFAAALLLPAFAEAQRTQLLPDGVTEVRLEGHQRLHVAGGDENRLETDSERTNIAVVRGSRLFVKTGDDVATLRLAPGRSIAIHAEDYATVTIEGSLPLREVLAVEVEDYASATFAGTEADTVRCMMLRLQTEDFSRITSTSILQHFEYDLSASDYSRIELAGVDQMPNPTDSSFYLATSISDFGKVYLGRVTDRGELVKTDFAKNDRDYTTTVNGATSRLADAVRREKGAAQPTDKKSVSWSFGSFDLDFAWGWHNWGREMFNGFAGVEGPSEVRTTFGNLLLAGNWGIATSRWIGLYAGLGLEWDRWKFTTPQTVFSTATDPFAFADGGASSGSTMLITRYVIVPITVTIGVREGVHLELSAIPGIHWNASGLRYKHEVGSHMQTDKDRSVNRYVNPYKFDVRAALYFKRWFGVYAQFSTQPVLKGGSEVLIPVRFGFIL